MRIGVSVFIQVALFSLAALWFYHNPGTLQVEWLGYRVETSVGVFAAIVGGAAILLYGTLRLIAGFFSLPRFFKARYSRPRFDKSFDPIEEAMRLKEKGKTRRALKLLESAWKSKPHRDLVKTYLRIKGPGTDLENYKKVQTLISSTPTHTEALLATAHFATQAKLWGVAREALTVLLRRSEEPKRVLLLQAELELGEHNNVQAAFEFQRKALEESYPSENKGQPVVK